MKYEEQYRKAQTDKTEETVTPIFKKFREIGEKIIGELLSYSVVESTVGEDKYNQYLFKTDEGLVKFALGAATDKEIVSSFELHGLYCIEFLGQIKITGGRSVNKFKVIAFPAESETVGDPDEDIAFP